MKSQDILSVAVVALMITNIVVIVKLSNLQTQAEGIVSKVEGTIADVQPVIDTLKKLFG